MALGKLGWTEYEFYTSSPEAFYFASRGYFSKLQDESLAVRNLAAIVMGVAGSKDKIDSVWPLSGEDKPVFQQPTKEWWAEMKAKQLIVDSKIKAKHGR